MAENQAEIRVRGRNLVVPSAAVGKQTVVITGRWPRIAALRDEELVKAEELLDPSLFMSALKRSRIRADLFTFIQKFPDVEPRYPFHMEWDNVAAIPVSSYEEWFKNQVSGKRRSDLKRSARRGVSVDPADFSDDFVRGVVRIYNETPIRQRRAFWHYGKDFPTVKSETETYLDQSEFLGAFFEGELIGFLKMVYVDQVAYVIHILSMVAHADKLPTNALIAKAVEVCAERGIRYLAYGKYSYGNSGPTSLTEFKSRNGFKKYLIPRYFIPLTPSGKVALKTGVHRGLKNLMPESAIRFLLVARAKYNRLRHRNSLSTPTQQSDSQE